MGLSLLSIIRRSILTSKQSSMASTNVPKGHFAVYVGEEQKRRLVVPISYLNHQWFQDFLRCSEEKFGFTHPMGGITIPCTEEAFTCHSSCLQSF
ncbi:hypothetical protein D8674_037958 [Pyrus ussuriensis x Pyrus communis]|uniref:Auxin-induced protein 15A-like n=1 Tax=Pyrus ussuriensis x Pyrus communis TaxID=2448454 RepID=A0A5N5FNA5_9ROSA|nr:hypothetical protein D8674_037958 [Pyrus ussuriensis x Pyrus communis]